MCMCWFKHQIEYNVIQCCGCIVLFSAFKLKNAQADLAKEKEVNTTMQKSLEEKAVEMRNVVHSFIHLFIHLSICNMLDHLILFDRQTGSIRVYQSESGKKH